MKNILISIFLITILSCCSKSHHESDYKYNIYLTTGEIIPVVGYRINYNFVNIYTNESHDCCDDMLYNTNQIIKIIKIKN